jgi:hypothetical protein
VTFAVAEKLTTPPGPFDPLLKYTKWRPESFAMAESQPASPGNEVTLPLYCAVP